MSVYKMNKEKNEIKAGKKRKINKLRTKGKLRIIKETEFRIIKRLEGREIVVMCHLSSYSKDRHFEDIGVASSEEPQIKKYKSFDKVMFMLLETSKKRAYRNVGSYLR